MPLIKYTQYITYPDGNPASNIAVPVWLLGGNQTIPVFSDKAGTLPVANPVMTDVDGMISVYAAPGPLTAELAGQVFPFLVDASETDPAWPNTFIHTQSVLASVWTVVHHFGVQPAVDVQVVNLSTEVEVSHPDDETTVLTFGTPTVGTARLRR